MEDKAGIAYFNRQDPGFSWEGEKPDLPTSPVPWRQWVASGWDSFTHRLWVNYNDLTTTSLEIMVSKGNHPQMALIQVREIL